MSDIRDREGQDVEAEKDSTVDMDDVPPPRGQEPQTSQSETQISTQEVKNVSETQIQTPHKTANTPPRTDCRLRQRIKPPTPSNTAALEKDKRFATDMSDIRDREGQDVEAEDSTVDMDDVPPPRGQEPQTSQSETQISTQEVKNVSETQIQTPHKTANTPPRTDCRLRQRIKPPV